jgi:hypothetical protein
LDTLIVCFLFAPSRQNIKIASTALIGLSNSLMAAPDPTSRDKYQKAIMEALEKKGIEKGIVSGLHI